MAALDFPTPTANGQVFNADTGVIYTYVGTPPNGYWSGFKPDSGTSAFDTRYLKQNDQGTKQTVAGGGGLDIAGYIDLDGTTGKVTSESTAAGDPAGTLTTKDYVDGRSGLYVAKTGDNMTGNLTLGPTPATAVIELNEDDGEILVKNNGDTTARLYNEGSLVLGKGTTTAGLQYSVGGTVGNGFLKLYGNSSTTSTSSAVWINNDREASDANLSLNYDGSATFAGGATQITSGGFINVVRPGGFAAYQAFDTNTDDTTVDIKCDGTASFAGQIIQKIGTVQNLRVNTEGSIFIGNKNGAGNITGNNRAISLSADGSGSFTGNVTAPGIVTPGVVFGTASGNVTSKTLDDYEEGTWTPVIRSGGWSGIDGANNTRYTKVGRQVTVECFITGLTGSPNTTTFEISGLPFNAHAQGYSVGVVDFQSAGLVGVYARVAHSNNLIQFFYPSGTLGELRNTVEGNDITNGYIILTVTYTI